MKVSLVVLAKSPQSPGFRDVTLDDPIPTAWRVMAGNAMLDPAAMSTKALAHAPRALESALVIARNMGGRPQSAKDLLRLAVQRGRKVGDLAFDGVRAEGWLSAFIGGLLGRRPPRQKPPRRFRGRLRRYQAEGLSWLGYRSRWGLGSLLADDMGLGKTVQALALLQARWESGRKNPCLLVCPASLVDNWVHEAAKFTPGIRAVIHHGKERGDFGTSLGRFGPVLVITTYALLVKDQALLAQNAWETLILDEAQNIKNPESLAAQAARRLRSFNRLALTGTPIENSLIDLWSLMAFLNPWLLGTREDFQREFSQADEGLRSRVQPFILRRLKSEPGVAAELPPKLEAKVYCPLYPDQRQAYDKALAAFLKKASKSTGAGRKGLILAVLTKLKQICNGEDLKTSGKLDRLTEMLDEAVQAGDRCLVFTQYAEMGKVLQKHLKKALGKEILYLHGEVPREKRFKMIEEFQDKEDGPPVFVLSLKAGGTGLNLTRASRVFHFDRWWNPAVEAQASDRAHRIGQDKKVIIYKFIATGTLEDHIDRMIEEKRGLAGEIVKLGESALLSLKDEELLDLLRAEAPVESQGSES